MQISPLLKLQWDFAPAGEWDTCMISEKYFWVFLSEFLFSEHGIR